MDLQALEQDDRPRERLVRLGAAALADRELLAVILGTGVAGHSALGLADRLLAHSPAGLGGLANLDPTGKTGLPGLGPVGCMRVLSALELGRRVAGRGSGRRTAPIRGPADVFARMGATLRDLMQEEFHVLLLDTRHRIRRDVLVTRGVLDGSLIHPREVFRPAIADGAAAVILVHNHPSGDPSPSNEDRVVTRRLSEAGETIGIAVLDHVIIGDGRYVSLAEFEREGGPTG